MDSEMSTWFPLLVPLNAELTEYDGFLKIMDSIFHVSLSIGDINEPATYNLCGDWELKELLLKTNRDYDEVLGRSKSVSHFLMEFCNLVEKAMKSRPLSSKIQTQSPENLQHIISSLQECGWSNVEHVSESANEIHMKHFDEAGRIHNIRIRVPEEFPIKAPACSTSLPIEYEPVWHKDKGTIRNIYDDFVGKVKQLQPFWSVMDEIDGKFWVLDPPKPRVSDSYRRISLGNNVSVVIAVDPRAPGSLPKLEFTGPEKLVTKFRSLLEKNAEKWDVTKSLCENIEMILESELPSKATTTMEEMDCMCGICYSFLLDKAVPEVVCDNPNCSKPFHEGCIYEWMRSLATVRQNFNLLFGECPYCSQPMSCKAV
ncbi:E3 ubiquitin-protein ligase FANCL-like [Ornithodoros turicata]|uniref:E3 ubiquitin-protein ligase FANCL-like n=1 Tax=Ornithodoros turicata TaxID=34597 RepID=UPI003139EABD